MIFTNEAKWYTNLKLKEIRPGKVAMYLAKKNANNINYKYQENGSSIVTFSLESNAVEYMR